MKTQNKFRVGLITTIICLPLMIVAFQQGQAHWGYTGEEGPDHWGDLDPAWEECASGMSQSPIDLATPTRAPMKTLKFFYEASELNIVNNGHTIQVNYQPGSYITVGGKVYDLLQFHFHSPSEHTVDGQPYDMVAHLVHKSADEELAVVGVLMEIGEASKFLKVIWGHIPLEEGEPEAIVGTYVNAKAMIPYLSGYYHYSGSLTTPPCSEGVRWFVMHTPMKVSAEQVSQFTDIFHSNARPVQPLNHRSLREDSYSR